MVTYAKFGLFILSVGVLLMMGCAGLDLSTVSDEDLERISDKAVVCNEPYIRVGTSCCLDKDDNKICDTDEGTEESQQIQADGATKTEETTQETLENFIISRTVDYIFHDSTVDKLGDEKTVVLRKASLSQNTLDGMNILEVTSDDPQVVIDFIKQSGKYLSMIAVYPIDHELGCTILKGTNRVVIEVNGENQKMLSDEICFPTEEKETSPLQKLYGDLRDYPSDWMYQDKFGGVVVVGKQASAQAVIGASQIIESLGGEKSWIKLDSEISDITQVNSILVGNACTNKLISQIRGNPSDCLASYSEGIGQIELYDHGEGNKAVLVEGKNQEDILLASKYLAENKGSLSGNIITVSDCGNGIICEIAEEEEEVMTDN